MNTNKELPFLLGNGRLGAAITGNAAHEKIRLYEESLWSGAYLNRCNSDSKNSIKSIRTLLKQGRPLEAQERIFESFTASPSSQKFYKDAGFLSIDFYDREHSGLSGRTGIRENIYQPCENLKQEQDYNTGIATVSFSTESILPSTGDFSRGTLSSSITYTREYFVSANCDVLVAHIASSTPKTIYFRARLEKPDCAKTYSLSDDTIVMLDHTGVPYAAMVTAVASGGTVFTRNDNLIVEGADDVTLYINIESEYNRRHFRNKSGNVHKKPLSAAMRCVDAALKKICFAAGTSYENLKTGHIQAFAHMMKGAVLESSDTEFQNKWEKDFYTMVSTSYNARIPSVKTAVWTDYVWGTENRYSINESLFNMAAVKTASPLFEESTFSLIKRIHKHGRCAAEKMYGASGFVCHGSTDIWGDPYPQGTNLAESYIPLGTCEIVKFIVDYYEFTLDKKMLNKNLKYIRHACDFFADYLVSKQDGLYLEPAFIPFNKDGKELYATSVKAAQIKEIKELFENAVKAFEYAEISQSRHSYSKASAVLSMLKEENAEPQKMQASCSCDCSKVYINSVADSIARSTLKKDRVIVEILPDIEKIPQDGSIKNLALRGNILADISWNQGKLKGGILHAKENSPYFKDITVIYRGKSYSTRISDGKIDLKNVLPSTL